jgi:hypothetical protein
MAVYSAEHPGEEPMLYPRELFAIVGDPPARRNARRVVARAVPVLEVERSTVVYGCWAFE